MNKSLRCLALLLCVMLCAGALPALAEESAAGGENRVLFQTTPYNERDPEDDSYETYTNRMVSDGQALYIQAYNADQQQLYRYAVGDDEPTLLYETENRYGEYPSTDFSMSDEQISMGEKTIGLLAGGDQIVVLNFYTMALGTVSDSGIAWGDQKVDLPDMMIQESDYSYMREINGAFTQSGVLYLAMVTQNWDGCDIYQIDLASGEILDQTFIKDLYQGVIAYKEGKVLTAKYTESGIVQIVTHELSSQKEEILIKEYSKDYEMPSAMYYDAASDSLYYVRNNSEVRCWPIGGTEEQVAYLPPLYFDNRIAGQLLGNTYAAMSYDGVVLRDVTEDLSKYTPIRIQGGYNTEAMEKYSRENPMIPLVQVQRYYDSSDQIATAIQTGELEIDIFNTSVGGMGYASLMKKGYMADLSGSQVLNDFVDSLYPELAETLRDDQGRLMAIPYEFGFNSWSVDRALWEQNYPGQELPKTFDELLDLYEAWENTHDPEEPYGFLRDYDLRSTLHNKLYNTFIYQQERDKGSVDFSDPTFYALMKRIEDLPLEPVDWENMTDEENQELSDFANSATIFGTYADGDLTDPEQEPLQYDDDNYMRGMRVAWAGPVIEEGQQPLVNAYMQVMFVNPNSENQENAIALLEYIVQNLPYYVDVEMRPGQNEPVVNDYYERNLRSQQKALEDDRKRLEEAEPEDRQYIEESIAWSEQYIDWFTRNGKYSVTEGAIQYYRENIGPYLYLNPDPLIQYDGENSAGVLINDIFWQYSDGAITLDEMIKQLSQKARMIQQERE